MSQEKLHMKKLKELLRLKLSATLSNQTVARALEMSSSTVSYYHRAARSAGLTWPLPEKMTDPELLALLTPHCPQLTRSQLLREPLDYKEIHQELRKKTVTLELLWEEYKTRVGERAYSYSQYCRLYKTWYKTLKPSMRQTHKAGEKAFVDYAGPKIPVIDQHTGSVRQAMIFVGVLGASNYTFAEATWTRSVPDWLGSHVRLFEFLGGVPRIVVPDNEKSGVRNACYYDPELNPSYSALACHYNVTILPARPAKPKDKAKVEVAVQVVERWIMARLRHRTFYTRDELNTAIKALLDALNKKPFKKLPGNRLEAFTALDKPALQPLPQVAFEYTEIRSKRVRLDYHVEIDHHFYSVPYHLMNKKVEYRLTDKTVEIFYQGQRRGSHLRSDKKGGTTTDSAHMPTSHQHYRQWTPQTFLRWADKVGIGCGKMAALSIQEQAHPECCRKIHSGFKRLLAQYGHASLEQACQYALTIDAPYFKSVRSILETKMYRTLGQRLACNDHNPKFKTPDHLHVRGAAYYCND